MTFEYLLSRCLIPSGDLKKFYRLHGQANRSYVSRKHLPNSPRGCRPEAPSFFLPHHPPADLLEVTSLGRGHYAAHRFDHPAEQQREADGSPTDRLDGPPSTLSTIGDGLDDDTPFNVLRICAATGAVSSVLAKASHPTVVPFIKTLQPGYSNFCLLLPRHRNCFKDLDRKLRLRRNEIE